MKSKRGNVWAYGMLAGICSAAFVCGAVDQQISLVTGEAIGNLSVAGRLSIDMHTQFMMSRTYEKDTILNWYNCGWLCVK